jgi:hypothetical protein
LIAAPPPKVEPSLKLARCAAFSIQNFFADTDLDHPHVVAAPQDGAGVPQS